VTRRRPFLAALGSALLAVAVRGWGQSPAKHWHIAYLGAGVRPPDAAPPSALRQALHDLGYVEGRNVTYVARWAEARSERLAGLAGELVALSPDLLVTTGWKGAHALKEATSTIPIVFVGAGDPVRGGLSKSMARPGGNATGISDQSAELSGKRLELLKQAVPAARRIAVLWNADDMAMTLRYREIEKAAQLLGVSVLPLGVREPEDFEQAFSAMTRELPDALLLVTDALTNLNRRRVLEFAGAHRVPAMYEYAFLVRDGGLISYGPDLDDMYRRAAVYADRILKGAAPGDLAIEQPTRYYLVVNLNTARSLALNVPSALLLRADEVIR
jgi:putative tryptophan/tyrosine transport system substrate-binding protein